MKRLVVALVVVAMVMAVAVPAMAAPQLTTSGSVNTNLKYTPGTGMTSESEIKFNVNMKSEEGTGSAKLHIEFAPVNREKKDSFGTLTPFGSDINLAINKAYLQTSGALWNDGPEIDVTLGDVDVKYSDWIAILNGVEGVKVDKINLAQNTIDVFHIWDGATDTDSDGAADKVVGAQAGMSLSGMDLSGSIIKRLSDGRTAYMAEATLMPVEEVLVDGVVAFDAANSAKALMVNSTVTTFPKYTIKAGYRSLDAAFAPPYAAQYDPNKSEQADVVKYAGQTGYNAEVSTRVANFDVTGKLDRYDTATEQKRTLGIALGTEFQGIDLSLEHNINTDLAANASTTDSKLVAQRAFSIAGHDINGKYTYKSNPDAGQNERKHTLEASTEADLAMLENVQLSAKVGTDGGINTVNYNVKAGYSAPNGITFGAEYDGAAGFSANAGMKVEF